jgi:asparagine synthase (glutamine-hydrolysing)
MSGGIDSTTLAAVATGVARERRNGQEIHAITSVYDTLVPDDERRFAQLAADHLRIPIHFDVRDDEPSFADWRELTIATPEPVANPAAFLAWARFMKKASSIAKVFLYGEGPDDALRYEWRAYLSHLAARRQGSAFVRAIASDIVMHPRPFLWSSARQLAGRRRDATRWRRTFPPWLEPGFVAARRLHERWQEHQDRAAVSAHPARPRAHHSFTVPQWPQLFEDCDLQGAAVHAEFRHPYLDVRLLQYMLAVPVMPWCRAKLLLRRSMRGTLPPEVVRRKKTPAAANVDRVRLAASGLPRLPPAPGVAAYLDLDRVPRRPESVVELRAALRALGLNFWLSAAPSSRQVSHEIAEGDRKRSDPAEAV